MSLRYATWDGESDDKNCLFSAEAERNFQEEAARKEKEKQEKEKAKQAEAAKAESTQPKKTVTEIAKGNNAEPNQFYLKTKQNKNKQKIIWDVYLKTYFGFHKIVSLLTCKISVHCAFIKNISSG